MNPGLVTSEANPRRLRLLLVANFPTQYSAPIFRRMAGDPRMDIRVVFLSLRGAEPGLDPEFGREVQWDIPLLDGYPWYELGGGRSSNGAGPAGLWRIVRRGGYDAVVLLTGYINREFWKTLVAAKLSGAAVLYGTDATTLAPKTGAQWKGRAKRYLWPMVFGLADQILAPSAATKALFRSLGFPEERITVTPFVVDNDWWQARAAEADRAATRAAWGVPQDARVALFCAKLQPWKRPQDVLRAFARCGLPDAWLVMAGDGPLRAELEAEAERLGIAARTRFLGFTNQSQLPAVYSAADLFVLPSQYDPCPVVVCEAMLCGRPAVISDECRGRFEIVRHGETGWVFPTGDVEALAAILRQALGDPVRLAAASRAALRRMETWTPRENINGLVAAVERAIGRRRKSRAPASA